MLPAKIQISLGIRCSHEDTLDPNLPTERTVKTDQTKQMHSGHFVGFVMRWLICILPAPHRQAWFVNVKQKGFNCITYPISMNRDIVWNVYFYYVEITAMKLLLNSSQVENK